MIRVAIVSATPALRSGIRALLGAEERIEIMAEAANITELSEPDGLDVIVLAAEEISTPAIREALLQAEPPPALLLLSERADAPRMLNGLPARAWGLLPVDASEEELIAAVMALNEGLLAASPAMLQPILGIGPTLNEAQELEEELTEREMDVLQLLAQGFPNKQIAVQLEISEHTVKFHSSAIYAKLGVTNRTEAVRRGARLGLVVL